VDKCFATINQLTGGYFLNSPRIIPKLSSTCCAMGRITPPMATDILKLVYLAYCHSVLTYGLIFWENSIGRNKLFNIKKTNLE
jgi:hypothetical protein